MRFVRPVLVVVLALWLAPAARAHDVGEVDHRDTPAELAGASIGRALSSPELARATAGTLPDYLPTTWCGASDPVSDDVADAAFGPTAPQIKVVYAYASDAANDFARWRDSLQANVSNIEQYLALQSGGHRALRFDMGTPCGPQYVDVQVVALPDARSTYLDDFDAVAGAVRAALGPAAGSRDVFVLADRLTDGSDGVYGTAEVYPADQPGPSNPHNAGGFAAIMWTPAGTTPNATGWQPTVMLHEITHNLGGVQWTAPHTSHRAGDPSGTYSHCWDGEDVMCYDDGPDKAHAYEAWHCPLASGAIPQTYDCGHDDYFDPAPAPGSYLATHWNVYDSVFLASCTRLGQACGGATVPAPPMNSAAPAVLGTPQPGALLTATVGTWANQPTGYAVQWQRGAGGGWHDIPEATGVQYVPSTADAGSSLRVTVTASNDDGAAIAASLPTAAVAAPASPPTAAAPRVAPPAPPPTAVRIRLRDRGRRTAGTLTATIRTVARGREVRTGSAVVPLPPGTWRLRLCAGPSRRAQRCGLSARVRARRRGVRLPAARVLVTAPGALRVDAAVVDGRLRVRARGQAATSR